MATCKPFKKAKDERLPEITKEKLAKLKVGGYSDGINGTRLVEGIPRHTITDCEGTPIKGHNNTWIVLGRDRPSGRSSGYGGRGDTQAGTIDIVVGRMGYRVREMKKDDILFVNPQFRNDASRIYISQKTDVDYNFRLVPGKVGSAGQLGTDTARPTAAIAIKSDNVRIIAREGIKLVTERKGTMNAQGGCNRSIKGIDLIAGNQDEGKYFSLQPIVKGNNLVRCLGSLAKHLEGLNGIVQALAKAQNTYNKALASHFHNSPFYGEPTTPSFVVEYESTVVMNEYFNQVNRSIEWNRKNLKGWRQNYLWGSGGSMINSRYNNVN